MRRKVLYILSIILIISTKQVFAEPLLIPAKDMLNTADLIIIGKVIDFSYSENKRSATVFIEEILKGEEPREKITITEDEKPFYYWHINFQKPEERYIILLSKERDEYKLLYDSGNYLVIDSNGQIMPEERIKLENEKETLNKKNPNHQGKLNGINMTLDYINNYQDFYNKNHNIRNVRAYKEIKSSTLYLYSISIVFIVVALVGTIFGVRRYYKG